MSTVSVGDVVKHVGTGALGTVDACCRAGACGGFKVTFHDIKFLRVCMTPGQLLTEFAPVPVSVGVSAPTPMKKDSIVGRPVKHRDSGIYGTVTEKDGHYWVVSYDGKTSWKDLTRKWIEAHFEFVVKSEDVAPSKLACDHDMVPYTGLFESFKHCSKCGEKE